MAVVLTPGIESLLKLDVHRLATLWQIERVDGTTFRFTDHSASLVFNGNTFTPAGGFDASARQKQDGLRARDLSVRGIISSPTITNDDLRAGRFRRAKITEHVVDWQYPWASEPDGISKSVFFLKDITFSKYMWTASLTGLVGKLEGTIGEVYSKTCRYQLFDERCTVVEATFTRTGEVTAIVNQRAEFDTDTSEVDGWFEDGLLTWTSGANIGLKEEIRSYTNTDGRMQLHLTTAFDIQVGDAFSATAGCDKLMSTCHTKFDNVINHGGFPTMPGQDAVLKTPNPP